MEDRKKFRNAVIEIDEVEYWIRPNAAEAIERGEEFVTLVRLFDKAEIPTRGKAIKDSIQKTGILDYLDRRQGTM